MIPSIPNASRLGAHIPIPTMVQRNFLPWSLASDMAPARKAASAMLVLRGAAKELARQMPPQAVAQGGLVNGVAFDPLTYKQGFGI